MFRETIRKTVALIVTITMIGIGFPIMAQAGTVSTQALMESLERQDRLERVDRVLSQEAVQEQLLAMGVDSASVQERIQSLTDEELLRLERDLDELPAGGILGLIGAVFVVLLILELVGVTNIFNRI